MNKLKDNLKHSGDFGVFAIGLYNGQTGNNFDKNKNFHWVTRFTYPFKVGNQIIEPGIQAYTEICCAKIKFQNHYQYKQRIYRPASCRNLLFSTLNLLVFKQNIILVKGPEYDLETQSIKEKPLYGGLCYLVLFH